MIRAVSEDMRPRRNREKAVNHEWRLTRPPAPFQWVEEARFQAGSTGLTS